ncbi:shikimate dehydrogenase [Candidatus Micrarchaeota archaeon]|nr:shikimate dehydrogenase [Candidatus Micrarchaeota archaeon]
MNTAKTRLVALIGDPVAHSLSPAIHNAGFAALGMDWAYVAATVKADELSDAVKGMQALGFEGFNSTMPHKTALVPLMDETDAFAEFCQAVNTVTLRGGRLHGYNTDGPGSLNALKAAKADVSNAVILGAGAAGRAMALALAEAGSKVTILNREAKKADGVAEKLKKSGHDATSGALGTAPRQIKNATVLCNATAVGMHSNETPVTKSALHKGLTVLDAVYAPRHTRLIQDAKAAGCSIVAGEDMLLHQAMIGFELWTGKKAPESAMRKAMEEGFRK